jgi:hypothetical protein
VKDLVKEDAVDEAARPMLSRTPGPRRRETAFSTLLLAGGANSHTGAFHDARHL